MSTSQQQAHERILALIDEAIEDYERTKREHPITRTACFSGSHMLNPVSR